MGTNFVFKDRRSDNSNRRKLTIIQQQGDEMLVDIERADTNVTEPGTPFNAEVLNNWNNKIDLSDNKSDTAISTANQAITKSDNAISKSNDAETVSRRAEENATGALSQVNKLVQDVDFSQIAGDGAPSVEFITNSDGTKKFSFKNLKGGKGDNVHVRYSFNKTSMTEQPTTSTTYIGFYYGETASNNARDYSWTRIWGAKTISSADYAQIVLNGTVNPEEIYFIEGTTDGALVVTVDASTVKYANTNSGLRATTIQAAIDELKKGIPTSLAQLTEKSYNNLSDKPDIPDNSSFTLNGLSEKSYDSLTDKPEIPDNFSFTLNGLSEKSYNSLTDKPEIPVNSTFSLSGLHEKSYNSLTDKPPVVNKEYIATLIGTTPEGLDRLAHLANNISINGNGLTISADYLNIQ